MVNKKQNGGDGYSVNVNRSIGGLPGFTRYSNNYKPVFDGDLLQTGGDCGCGSTIPQIDNSLLPQNGGGDTTCGGTMPLIDNSSTIQNGGEDCGCGKQSETSKNSIYELIQKQLSIQSGGKKTKSKKGKNITQFHAIREVAFLLGPLQIKALITVIVKTFLNILNVVKPKKSNQMGGYIQELEGILAPLGKNNLLVLASLLLLHHFAVEKPSMKKIQSGGGLHDSFIGTLTSVLAPIGLNQLGASVVLVTLQQAFSRNSSKSIENKKQSGGNPLKELIAPLGTNAFIATGIIIVLEKLFTNKMNSIKKSETKDDKKKKVLIGGRFNKYYEKIFNMVSPITFNAFATEDILDKMINPSKK